MKEKHDDKDIERHLTENGYSQSKEDPDNHIGQNERGSYKKVELDGDWIREIGPGWAKMYGSEEFSSPKTKDNQHEETPLSKLEKQLRNEGYQVKVFSRTISEIVTAIVNKESIDGVNLIEKIQDSNFRFLCKPDPALSLAISTALVVAIQNSKSISNQKASEIGVRKRQENADDFAIRMQKVVEKLKTEEEVTSQRELVKLLNQKQIPTYRGGNWHLKTLQDLNKRWQELGLVLPKPK